jgi:hypothetical protein
VHSEGPGQGAEFVLELPVAAAMQVPARPADDAGALLASPAGI